MKFIYSILLLVSFAARSQYVDTIRIRNSLGDIAYAVVLDTTGSSLATYIFVRKPSGGFGLMATSNILPSIVSAGTYKSVTVNAKGLVTAGSNFTFSNTASRSIVTTAAAANGFQVSSTKDAFVNYSVTIVSTANITGAASGYVALEICTTNSATAGDWVEVARVANGQAVSLAVTLQSVSTGGGQISCIVPAAYYARLRSVNTAGTPTFSYNSGQEITY